MITQLISSITKREKYSVAIVISVLVSVYLAYNVFDPLYFHLLMGDSFPLSNIRILEWHNSFGMGLFALSGMQMVVGIIMFPLVVIGKSTTPLIPGVFFFAASYISIPVMIKITSGITAWRRMLYIYLTATQLSTSILAYWTNFGA